MNVFTYNKNRITKHSKVYDCCLYSLYIWKKYKYKSRAKDEIMLKEDKSRNKSNIAINCCTCYTWMWEHHKEKLIQEDNYMNNNEIKSKHQKKKNCGGVCDK